MDKLLPSRHSGESRNPVPSSDIHYYNQINKLDPGLRRGDKRGNQAVMIFSQTLRAWFARKGVHSRALGPGYETQKGCTFFRPGLAAST